MELDRDLASIQEVRDLLKQAQKAQDLLKSFTREQVEKVVDALRIAGEAEACRLAAMAVNETGMGNYEDKCFKNFFAARYVYEYMKDMKTVGIIRKDETNKIWEIAEPVGVIAGIVPTTNPTSTIIYKSMIALKARNAIVFSPHPTAVHCTAEAARVMNKAAVAAGAPEGVIGCLTNISLGATQELMKNSITKMILATGGSGLVKAAYSSGKPALGVGPGNVPAFVERSADIANAAKCIVTGKSFDNGTICASEQSIVVESCIAAELKNQLKRQGAYFLDQDEAEKVSEIAILPNASHGMNPKIVGRNPQAIAALAGIKVPDNAKCLVASLNGVGPQWPLSYEKLSTILGFYEVKDWQEGCERCIELLENGGIGHSLAIHSNNQEIIEEFAMRKPIFRILVNTPSALGGVGATTGLAPSFTLGCGTWGGSSVSENVTPLHLINTKRVAWHLRMPEGPSIQPLSSVATSVGKPTVDVKLVEAVIEQVLKAMNNANI
jgi:acetaldehyde dehydrogenase (acetylating)